MSQARKIQYRYRWLLNCCALLVLGCVAAGTLAPFSFDTPIAGADQWFGLTNLKWAPASASDIWTNILVYLPVGAILWLATARVIRRPLARLTLVTYIGMAMSLSLEWAQTLISARVASSLDVCLNQLGTALGAAGAAAVGLLYQPLTHRLRRAIDTNALWVATLVLTLGYVLYGLVPFDFVTNSESLRQSLGQAQFRLFSLSTESPVDAHADWIAWFGQAGRFALLGFVALLSYRGTGVHLSVALRSVRSHVLIVALIIEVLQILVISHDLDVRDWLACSVGGVLGMAAACRLWQSPRAISIRTALAATLVAMGGYVLICGISPFDLATANFDPSRLFITPFAAYVARPFAAAIGSIMEMVATYALLAALVRSYLFVGPGLRGRWSAIITIAAVVSMALACEVLQLFSASRHADLTDVLPALFASMIVAHWPGDQMLARVWSSCDKRLTSADTSPATIPTSPLPPLARGGWGGSD